MITFLISIIIAYLLGSISCSILLAKYVKLPDPRDVGSGNAGTINVLRTAGKNKAITVLVGDALKGIIAVLIGRILGQQGIALGLVAFAAVIGHVYPVFFKFRGGKGVATALGSILLLNFWVGIIALIIWGIIAAVFRYASMASLAAIVVSPFLFLIFGYFGYFIPALLIAALIVWKHWANIQRLRNKTEPKIHLNNPTEVAQAVDTEEAGTTSTMQGATHMSDEMPTHDEHPENDVPTHEEEHEKHEHEEPSDDNKKQEGDEEHEKQEHGEDEGEEHH
jgi:glycerol-3-phosphate acyltransferase PlsY